jgi:protein TonB
LRNPKPLYPEEARKKGYYGEVMLRVEVLPNGQVGQIELQRSSGYDLLDRSALGAVRQWRFLPAKKGETHVSSWVHVPIKFQLE